MAMIFISSADVLPQQILENGDGTYYTNEVICNGNETRLIDCADGFIDDCHIGGVYFVGVKCLNGSCLVVLALYITANCIIIGHFLGVFMCIL